MLRWGVAGPGTIAGDWVEALQRNTDQRVQAVGSRSSVRAERFAERHGIPRHYGSYEALVADPEIDIVYVAVPNSEHRKIGLLAIAAGKHVLIEKPLARNCEEARGIAVAAREAGVFAVEGMWSRFLPQTDVLARLLEGGELGEVLAVSAHFGTCVAFDPAARVFDPDLGGGVLLDLGVYPVWFALFVLGMPSRVTARGTYAISGVEDHVALILDFHSGAQAVLTNSLRVATGTGAQVFGTGGRVDFVSSFVSAGSFDFWRGDSVVPIRWSDRTGLIWRQGLCFQAAAVAVDISEGRIESSWHPMESSIQQLAVLDEARCQLETGMAESTTAAVCEAHSTNHHHSASHIGEA